MATSSSNSPPPPPLPPRPVTHQIDGPHPSAVPIAITPPAESNEIDKALPSENNASPKRQPAPEQLVVAPTPRINYKPLGLAHLLLAKFNNGYTGPVPEPSPSPIVVAPAGSTTHDARFFDPDNPEAKAVREKLAMETLEEIFDWLRQHGGKVAIHDATNSTVSRRRALLDRVKKEKGVKAMFIGMP